MTLIILSISSTRKTFALPRLSVLTSAWNMILHGRYRYNADWCVSTRGFLDCKVNYRSIRLIIAIILGLNGVSMRLLFCIFDRLTVSTTALLGVVVWCRHIVIRDDLCAKHLGFALSVRLSAIFWWYISSAECEWHRITLVIVTYKLFLCM